MTEYDIYLIYDKANEPVNPRESSILVKEKSAVQILSREVFPVKLAVLVKMFHICYVPNTIVFNHMQLLNPWNVAKAMGQMIFNFIWLIYIKKPHVLVSSSEWCHVEGTIK